MAFYFVLFLWFVFFFFSDWVYPCRLGCPGTSTWLASNSQRFTSICVFQRSVTVRLDQYFPSFSDMPHGTLCRFGQWDGVCTPRQSPGFQGKPLMLYHVCVVNQGCFPRLEVLSCIFC